MAFSSTGLVTVCAAKAGNAPSMYLYKTADTQATVNTVSYFDSIASLLKVGDIIFVYDSTTPSLVLTYVNAVSSAGVVDIAAASVVEIAVVVVAVVGRESIGGGQTFARCVMSFRAPKI